MVLIIMLNLSPPIWADITHGFEKAHPHQSMFFLRGWAGGKGHYAGWQKSFITLTKDIREILVWPRQSFMGAVRPGRIDDDTSLFTRYLALGILCVEPRLPLMLARWNPGWIWTFPTTRYHQNASLHHWHGKFMVRYVMGPQIHALSLW